VKQSRLNPRLATKPALSAVARIAGFFAALMTTGFQVGCSSNSPTPPPETFNDRQQAALKDPMGYKVPPTPDVSDGNTTTFDKSGFQRDLNDAVNP
jgi:hypothetical protein